MVIQSIILTKNKKTGRLPRSWYSQFSSHHNWCASIFWFSYDI